jgi:acid phosphatase (class A)
MVAGLLIAVALAGAAPGGKMPSMLDAADLDPALILPAPPVKDSAQAVAEMAELHAIEAARSPGDLASARADSDTKDATIFVEVLGPAFDLPRLPETAKLFAIVRATEKEAADRGKDEFKRPRPWIVDAGLKTCSRDDEPLSSYPSGHTTMGFSMGGVLARLVPEKAPAIMARAARYGQNRVVCEQHFRSDVTAGQMLGLLIAERLMAKPDFRTAFDAAHRELVGAGIAAQ